MDTDGSYLKGGLLNSTITETWARPSGCTTRDADGNIIQMFSLPVNGTGKECQESPQTGIQFDKILLLWMAIMVWHHVFVGGTWVMMFIWRQRSNPPVPGDYLVEVVPDDRLVW